LTKREKDISKGDPDLIVDIDKDLMSLGHTLYEWISGDPYPRFNVDEPMECDDATSEAETNNSRERVKKKKNKKATERKHSTKKLKPRKRKRSLRTARKKGPKRSKPNSPDSACESDVF